MQASSPSLSQSCFLQPFSRVGTEGSNTLNLVYQESPVGKMHGHKLCRQYTLARLQEPKNTYSQSFQGYSPKRQMFHGMVLRLQAASNLQWERRDPQLYDNTGDVDDRKPLEYNTFVEFMYGKLVGDKGYISKNLFQRLFVDGIQLVGKLKSNMKGSLMSVYDKMLLRKRAIIKTNNDGLKTSHK